MLLALNSKRKTLKERLEENFGKKQVRTFCKQCKEIVTCTYQPYLAHLPKSIFVVVDAFDKKGELRRLLPRVPRAINLGKHTNDPHKSAMFLCTGVITQDPFFLDYKCALRNKKKDEDRKVRWAQFDKRGMTTILDHDMFERCSIHNAQIMLYQKAD